VRARASRYLRRVLIFAAVAFLIFGSISYLLPGWIGRRWRSDDGVNEIWVSFGSHFGQLTFYYDSESKSYSDWRNALETQRQGKNSVFGKLGWTVRLLPALNTPRWGFVCRTVTQRGNLPTTGPAFIKNAVGTPFSISYLAIALPYWFLVLLTGSYPLYSLTNLPHQRRQKRFDAGQCIACGYDLRHSPERCPECGTARTTTPPTTGASIREILAFRREKWWQIGLYPIALAIYLLTFWRIYYSHR
jgi:hypothetical protein